jgi:hypothetical protein
MALAVRAEDRDPLDSAMSLASAQGKPILIELFLDG